MQKFTKQLPKEDLKKFAKEIGKKLVASDFKNGRVDDPTKISEKQEKKVKQYVKQFFEKAVEKKKEIDKRKKEKEKAKLVNGISARPEKLNGNSEVIDDVGDIKAEDIDLTPSSPSPPGAPSSPHPSIPATPSFTESSLELKRKRLGEESPGDEYDIKRLKEEDATPPPPPPPPPAEGMPDTDMDVLEATVLKEETEEEKELRRQEEDLMRENEEAIKMEQDGSLKTAEENAHHHSKDLSINGNSLKSELGDDSDVMEGVEDTNGGMKHERESLMSH
jgi:histone-lysine N-methyltransferase SETD2